MDKLNKVIQKIQPLNKQVMHAVKEHVDQLTKPVGSLGRIEELAIQLGGITDKERPTVHSPAVIIAAADHGIVAEGVSAYPQEVTKLMIHNFINGGAAINVFAKQIGAAVHVLDVGVNGEIEAPEVIVKKIKSGTNNFYREDAMTECEAIRAIEVGIEEGERLIDEGHHLLIIGEMGIGNTTSSSALISAYTGANVVEIVGHGTGLDEEGYSKKITTIKEALHNRKISSESTSLEIFAKVGGLEIGALAGVILAAASRRVPVIIDGLISSAAALVAYELCPTVKEHFIISHQSVEPGHEAIFTYLHKKPLLSLDLRLGEGTGAALSYPLLVAATHMLNEMATFADLGIEKK
ncbi:nicotinate-nucleotide--dimethylbenzimidazole phosphoribosyltransferase [Bacillus sp. FJAT-45350]|uniref:nicotinate-nucleotide--dimethylbenzimidazole phosphoribosyltransferase n=1 Tax=Bacillus sp. FJAT-45350 TaxID=2011014 RepID=UPI000BB7A603|nr:nicotinate-nucleotide--dimethylbenzimidazole phosphoribosyltransferase [Bacillus sp. FJAT-45350]